MLWFAVYQLWSTAQPTASKCFTNIVAVLFIKTLIGAILTLLSLQFQLEPPTPTCDGITGGSVQQQQQRWPAGGKVVQQHSSSQVAFLPVDELVACTLRPAWCTHKHRLALCFSMQTFTRGWSPSWVQQLCTRKLALSERSRWHMVSKNIYF